MTLSEIKLKIEVRCEVSFFFQIKNSYQNTKILHGSVIPI